MRIAHRLVLSLHAGCFWMVLPSNGRWKIGRIGADDDGRERAEKLARGEWLEREGACDLRYTGATARVLGLGVVVRLSHNTVIPNFSLRSWRPAWLPTTLFTTLALRAFGRNFVRKSASSPGFLPHLSFSLTGDVLAVDPNISSGLPIASLHRFPPPGSRPEKYSTPATKGT